MKLATIDSGSGTAPAIIVGDRVVDLSPWMAEQGHSWRDVGEILADGGIAALAGAEAWAKGQGGTPVAEADFLTPVTRPARIMAVAANYRAHVRETKVIEDAAREETAPWFFDKPLASLNPHRSPIVLPVEFARKVDWEAELGVVIGRTARRVSVEDALDYVAGYTLINDISARGMDVPQRTKIRERDKFHDWLHGKWFDTFCCVGPWMVTADEIPDPQALTISLSVSGKRYQHASTADMLFNVRELISFASHLTTLSPGDLLATGTPDGVGKASNRFLEDGDVVSMTIEGVGTLENPVRAGA